MQEEIDICYDTLSIKSIRYPFKFESKRLSIKEASVRSEVMTWRNLGFYVKSIRMIEPGWVGIVMVKKN